MSAPLLTTKLFLPPLRPHLIPRPRLTRRLSEGLGRPLTLISAPAGFGKTTLLSEWRATPEGRETPVAWLSLDGHDNEPARFWSYLIGALERLPDSPQNLGHETMELLRAGVPVPPAELLTPLINGISSEKAVLVLDDYHVIESPAIHDAVSFLVEHLPPGLRLVVLTRSDPPWPLARLRAHKLMAELRSADLRFTAEEAAAFLNRTIGLELAVADIAALERRTEGWVAALQMVALSLEGHTDPRGFIAAFSGDNRYIADYLAEEVIARQPEPVQEFLLGTAILSRLTATLCEAVTGQAGGQAMLERIERSNLFLIPLDTERRWYRYHHLFGDLLRARLMQSRPDLAARLHSRASLWFEESGATLEAVEHALAAGEHERAAGLIEQHADGWWALASGQFLNTMLRLPQEVIRSRPSFTTYMAWINIVAGNLTAAADFLRDAERHPGDSARLGFLALMRAYIAELSGQPYTMTDEVLAAPGQIPETSVGMRNSADVVLAFLLDINGQPDRAAELLEGVARRDLASGTTNGLPIAISRLTKIRNAQGRTAEAEAICRHYMGLIAERGAWRYFINGNLYAALSLQLLTQGRAEEALAAAEEGLRQNERWGTPSALAIPLNSMARAYLAMGEPGQALEALDRIAAVTQGRALPMEAAADVSATRLRTLVALGQFPTAVEYARQRGLHSEMAPEYRREPEQIAFAGLLLAQRRQAEAETLIRRLAAAAEAGGRLGRLAEMRMLTTPHQATVERLSERELEILRLMAGGLSNQQIADQLYLSIGTVKTHIHNLSGKLEAQSRTHAVARARELRLI
ncbi:MAG TPA: LuxR C-terminal-related transcriptional regulator [Symbiobacteriaceae bacterium]|nr:LuxR C-terminal-related transcriptional regulator [Symbiobacteriaceae bacterium]